MHVLVLVVDQAYTSPCARLDCPPRMSSDNEHEGEDEDESSVHEHEHVHVGEVRMVEDEDVDVDVTGDTGRCIHPVHAVS